LKPEPHVRNGFGAVRPYVYGYPDMIPLIESAFDAEILEKDEKPSGGAHVEARIGDSVIVLEASDPPPRGGTPGSIYVYVPDVDKAYRRALDAGAESISPPSDKPYKERGAGVRDRFGNTWWIATYTGKASE
jgi:PhnB protein